MNSGNRCFVPSEKVITHYNNVAKGYDKFCEIGVLKFFRQKELQAVKALVQEIEPGSVLDFGAGSGFYSRLMKSLGHEVTCVDVSEEMVNVCRSQGFEALHGSLEAIPENRKWDMAMVMGVLEFNKAWREIILEVGGHIVENGRLLVLFQRRTVAGYMFKYFYMLKGIRIRLVPDRELFRLLQGRGFTLVGYEFPNLLTCVSLFRKRGRATGLEQEIPR